MQQSTKKTHKTIVKTFSRLTKVIPTNNFIFNFIEFDL